MYAVTVAATVDTLTCMYVLLLHVPGCHLLTPGIT